MINGAGKYITNLHGKLAYKSFNPTFLPLDFEIDISSNIISLLVEANKKLALLEGLSCFPHSLNRVEKAIIYDNESTMAGWSN